MDVIVSINDAVNGFVWGAPAIILIMGVGLYLTIRLKGIQFRNWGFMFSRTYAKAFKEAKQEAKDAGEGEITSFQAAMASANPARAGKKTKHIGWKRKGQAKRRK